MKLAKLVLSIVFSSVSFITISAQESYISVGEINDSIYIIEDAEQFQEAPNYGNNYYYIDIDNNGIIDMAFDFHSHGNGWGGQGGIKVSCQDNTMVKINQKVVQFIGPCENRLADTTHNVQRLNMGDVISIDDYYQNDDHITYLSTGSDPCYIYDDIDDWEDGTYYLGFKKIINNKTKLGWIKIEVVGKWKVTFKEVAFTEPIAQRKYPIINEFLSWNFNNIQDEYGQYDSWIELYNPHQDSIILGGLSMSVEIEEDDRWELPSIYMEPNGYLIIWADGQTSQGPLHTNFHFNHYNNQLSLFDLHGSIIDKHYYHSHDRDISEGRFPNASAGSWEKFTVPTPGTSNSPTSILDITNEALKIFPNPSYDNIFYLSRPTNFKIYSIGGKLIFEKSNTNKIDLSNYNRGTYYLVTSNNEQMTIIVQ